MTCISCENEVPVGDYKCTECTSGEAFDEIVSNAFGIGAFSYNSAVQDDFFNVMKRVAAGKYNSEIAKDTEMKESHVELIQYLLCNGDHADYGTSPRGCWLTPKGWEVFEQLKALRSL